MQICPYFFSVAHNPTQLNRQGYDVGSQYRSAIFYTSSEQQKISQGTIQKRTAGRIFTKPVVTQVVPLRKFFPAEKYHQKLFGSTPK